MHAIYLADIHTELRRYQIKIPTDSYKFMTKETTGVQNCNFSQNFQKSGVVFSPKFGIF